MHQRPRGGEGISTCINGQGEGRASINGQGHGHLWPRSAAPAYGFLPVTSSHIITPKENTSALMLYVRSFRISGAEYSGVPAVKGKDGGVQGAVAGVGGGGQHMKP